MWERWLDIAKQDLKAAKSLLGDNFFPESAFFSQQAAEKALKAVNIKVNRENVKGHSLISIANAIKAPKEIILAAQELTTHFVSSRYPDIVENILEYYDFDMTKKLYDYSKMVVEWSTRKLENFQKK